MVFTRVEIRPSVMNNDDVQDARDAEGISASSYGEEDDNEYTYLDSL